MGKEQRRVKGSIVSIATITMLACFVGAADESGLANQCSKDFQSVMSCLNFAQGKAEKPSKECCGSVSSVKENEPKCLCYILQQSQTSGAQSLKSMGVQQDKLFQLPTACQLKNASVSDCPKLLGLAPNSPDAAIFTNSSSTTVTPARPSSGSQNADDKSGGTKLEAADHFVGPVLLVASAVFFFFYALPDGIA
ncbi:Glycosylphosphatidylinositol-anchored lipid protein transfer 1, putative isoform 2 [Hibiscus syriacus]|uniref:Glycosylphosphatidylinositol-anchored lipid protein transfer 1, putative isoform 2 n=1 Tax=Hibiscus syriacus TaxID=106335 RepID=A0A6A2ZGY1_HIBSY|nr:non-specific lipid transfer protein GPI-anchored 1-like [Hibiscus syriacus]KAE8690850.1 Glycosylphosphatidylinositol-anchored lipid protein transfer 1, putative isoform 2 [Hibiscus syriacus]